jgi:hypothetical protein
MAVDHGAKLVKLGVGEVLTLEKGGEKGLL